MRFRVENSRAYFASDIDMVGIGLQKTGLFTFVVRIHLRIWLWLRSCWDFKPYFYSKLVLKFCDRQVRVGVGDVVLIKIKEIVK